MIKILDIPITIDIEDIRKSLEILVKENRINYQYLVSLEEELKEFLDNSKLTISCTLSPNDFSSTIQPVSFNELFLVNNTDVLIKDNTIINE